jgi:hypothetical protein
LEIILGVVPLDTSEWNPDSAPQAMVMNTNGKMLPAKIGPVPSAKRLMGGILISGAVKMMAAASRNTTEIFRNVEM